MFKNSSQVGLHVHFSYEMKQLIFFFTQNEHFLAVLLGPEIYLNTIDRYIVACSIFRLVCNQILGMTLKCVHDFKNCVHASLAVVVFLCIFYYY